MPNFSLKDDILKLSNSFVTLLGGKAQNEDLPDYDKFLESYACATALHTMIENGDPVFIQEDWHSLGDHHYDASELLLRLKTPDGDAIPPYPFVMTCYENGLSVQLDTLLMLLALDYYHNYTRKSDDVRVSVNVSAKFFENRNMENIEVVFDALDRLHLNVDQGEAIILEVHESAPGTLIDPHILNLFRKKGVLFAMDDVMMDSSDILRFSGFKNYTDFVKLDRKFLLNNESDPVFFASLIDFIRANAPDTKIIAEGVKTPEHARKLRDTFKHIEYVQGRSLPDRATFARDMAT